MPINIFCYNVTSGVQIQGVSNEHTFQWYNGRIDLPQAGWSCSQVKGKLNVPRRQVQRDEVAGGVAVVAIVKYNSVGGSRFQRDSQFQPG